MYLHPLHCNFDHILQTQLCKFDYILQTPLYKFFKILSITFDNFVILQAKTFIKPAKSTWIPYYSDTIIC